MLRLLLVMAIPTLPGIAALLCWYYPRQLDLRASLITSTAVGLAWGCAVLTLGLTLSLGPRDYPLLSWQHTPLFGLLIDRFSAVMVVLVTTISAMVHLYARRAMRGEPRYATFFALLSAVTMAVIGVLLADSLVMLCCCWALKGWLLSRLIGHDQTRLAAQRAARQKLVIDGISDGALVVALALAWHTFGTLSITALNAAAIAPHAGSQRGIMTLITMMLLVAALVKSAQLPFGSWLPAALEAPTPVSALMHAGLVNAGGFLIIRLSPLFSATPVTLGAAALVGTLTLLYGTSVMLTRSDVKNRLVYSTMGQMGFMILECGLGAYAVAVVHLIAHGIFKATLFLGAGDAINQRNIDRHLGDHHPNSDSPLGAWSLQLVGLVVGGIIIITIHGSLGSLLFLFAWLSGTSALLRVQHVIRPTRVLLILQIVLTSALYSVVVRGAEAFLGPVVGTTPMASPLAVILLITLLGVSTGLVAWAQSTWRPAWLARAADALYVHTLQRGYLYDAPLSLFRTRRIPIRTWEPSRHP